MTLTKTERRLYDAFKAKDALSFQDLFALVSHPGSIVAYDKNLVAVHVMNLRRKLEGESIESLRGFGYRLV